MSDVRELTPYGWKAKWPRRTEPASTSGSRSRRRADRHQAEVKYRQGWVSPTGYDDCVRRARCYEDVCLELERARAAHVGARARRRAEREAIWRALERNGLVTRTRGRGAVTSFRAEGVS